VHFEVMVKGVPMDPLKFLASRDSTPVYVARTAAGSEH
jgi:hypothetical protein